MSQTKSNIFLNIIYFIIAFLVIFLFVFIIYENFVKINNPLTDTSTTTLTEEQIDTLGEVKFDWMNTSLNKQTNYPIFFTNTNLDSSNFNNNNLLTISYDALSSDDKSGTGTSDSSCFKDSSGNKSTVSTYKTDCYKETFDYNVLEEQINKTFTSSIKVNYTDFIPSGSEACFYTEPNYTCILNMNDIDLSTILIITGYDHSEYNDGKLIVYSKLLTVKRNLDIYPADIQGIYSDIDATNKIADLTYYSEVTSSGLSSDSRDALITKYQDLITTYKSVFTRNSNGDYVWESTSII